MLMLSVDVTADCHRPEHWLTSDRMHKPRPGFSRCQRLLVRAPNHLGGGDHERLKHLGHGWNGDSEERS